MTTNFCFNWNFRNPLIIAFFNIHSMKWTWPEVSVFIWLTCPSTCTPSADHCWILVDSALGSDNLRPVLREGSGRWADSNTVCSIRTESEGRNKLVWGNNIWDLFTYLLIILCLSSFFSFFSLLAMWWIYYSFLWLDISQHIFPNT